MDCRHVTMIALTCAGLTGCLPQQHAQRQLLERELRLQEDYIYDLEYELEQAHEQLECCAGPCSHCGSGGSSTNGSTSSGSTYPDDPPGAVDPPGTTDPPDIMLPEVDLPEVDLPDVQVPGGMEEAPPFEGPPSIIPVDPAILEGMRSSHSPQHGGAVAAADVAVSPPGTLPSVAELLPMPIHPQVAGPAPAPTSPAALEDWQVSEIALNPALTGPLGNSGSGGLVVFIEPRNTRREIVEMAGDVSIVALDPALQGDAARVARWDFTSSEAASRLRRTAAGSGLHFQLAWPGRAPRNAALKLFVRLITDDGRKLVAELPIDLRAEGPAQQAWTGQLQPAAEVASEVPQPSGPPWFGEVQQVGWKAASPRGEHDDNAPLLDARGEWSPNR